MKNKIALYVATWFGTGQIPPVIGSAMGATYGSFFALPICFLVLILGFNSWFLATLLIFIFGFWSVPIAERLLGPQIDNRGGLRTRDQNQIVIDEVLGMLIATFPLLSVLFSNYLSLIFWLLITFLSFRFFDIFKSFALGAKYFDRMESVFGVMFDDVIAGFWTAVVVWLLVNLVH